NATGTNVIQPQTGESHDLELIVRPSGPNVRLFALWDGQPASHWEGTLDQLGQLERFSPNGDPALCLCVAESAVRVFSAQLGLISGDIRHREPPPGGKLAKKGKSPPAKSAAPVKTAQSLPTEGIDLLKLVDTSKHVQRGSWRRDGDVLVATPEPNGSL